MAIETKMDGCEIRNRLDSLGSTESDVAPLWSLKPSAGKPILEFLEEFYDYRFRGPEFAPSSAPMAPPKTVWGAFRPVTPDRTSTVTPTLDMRTAGLPSAHSTPGSTSLPSGPTPSKQSCYGML